MKQIVYNGKNKFEFFETNRRQCNLGEVEIESCVLGLCGSDLQKFLKQTPNNGYLKTKILGHEICGIVSNIGENVKKCKIGDRIVVNPFNVPDNYKKCNSFSLEEDIDIVGRTIDGGYSELIYLPQNCVYKLPDRIKNEEAIFIDDVAVALHGIHYISQYGVKPDNIAIIGDGPLGILCYRILKEKYKNSNMVLVCKNKAKLKKLDLKTVEFNEIDKYNEMFDVILEVVGGNQIETIDKAIKIGKSNCLILCYGVFEFGLKANVDLRTLFYKQGIIKGVNSYCNVYDEFNEAINLLEKKKIKVDDLITNNILFDDAVDYIKSYNKIKNNIKTIFEVKK